MLYYLFIFKSDIHFKLVHDIEYISLLLFFLSDLIAIWYPYYFYFVILIFSGELIVYYFNCTVLVYLLI